MEILSFDTVFVTVSLSTGLKNPVIGKTKSKETSKLLYLTRLKATYFKTLYQSIQIYKTLFVNRALNFDHVST